MIKVHYKLNEGPFGDEKVERLTFVTSEQNAWVEFQEHGWVIVYGPNGGQIFAVQGHKVEFIQGSEA